MSPIAQYSDFRLERVRQAPGHVVRWWLQEWRASIPGALRHRATKRRAARLLIRNDVDGMTFTFFNRIGKTAWSKRVGWFQYSRAVIDAGMAEATAGDQRPEIHLALTEADVISQSMPVPAQARFAANDIVLEHIRRKTPFRPDQVMIGFEVRTTQSGRAEIRYIALPQATLNRVLARLQLTLSELAVIEGPSRDGESPLSIVIKPEEKPSVGRLGRFFGKMALAIAVICLLSMATFAWQQHQTLKELTGRLEAVAGSAAELSGHLRHTQEAVGQIDRLTKLREAPSAVELWEVLAKLLPETTWLTELQIAGGTVKMSGYSAATTEIIPILSQSALFVEVSLSAPIVVDPAKGKERFALDLKLRTPRLRLENGY